MMIYIEQPAFLPWLGFCEALVNCDTVALFDDVGFVDGGWQNRNRVKTANGVEWITVPVVKKSGQLVRDTRISPTFNAVTLQQKLKLAYGRAPFYDEAMQVISPSLTSGAKWLMDLNVDLLNHISIALDGKARLTTTSGLGTSPADGKSVRVAEICHGLGSTTLWAGSGTRGYLDTDELAARGISVIWNEYQTRHPSYVQYWRRQGFVPGLSVVDAVCNLSWAGLSALLRAEMDLFMRSGRDQEGT